MKPSEIRVPGGGIRWWLAKRCVRSEARVEIGTIICLLEMTTGVFSSEPEAHAELAAPTTGTIEWADIPEGSIVDSGQVLGWVSHPTNRSGA